jgi:hypothetical protein
MGREWERGRESERKEEGRRVVDGEEVFGFGVKFIPHTQISYLHLILIYFYEDTHTQRKSTPRQGSNRYDIE